MDGPDSRPTLLLQIHRQNLLAPVGRLLNSRLSLCCRTAVIFRVGLNPTGPCSVKCGGAHINFLTSMYENSPWIQRYVCTQLRFEIRLSERTRLINALVRECRAAASELDNVINKEAPQARKCTAVVRYSVAYSGTKICWPLAYSQKSYRRACWPTQNQILRKTTFPPLGGAAPQIFTCGREWPRLANPH